MDALLNPAAARLRCASAEDLQLQLRGLLASKVSPTKAEHITVTFEIQSTAVFHINESDTSQAGQNLDPSLGGLPISPSGQATREIVANDTLVNQPQDTPTLQKIVCRQIITALEGADQSSWTVRQVSRTSSGWTFTYICRDSTQAWSRQNAKNKDRPVIGASSQKDDQDPVNLSRPAFDCRGSITIAFVRSTRTINVRYDHTPLHKTVSQLLEYYAPPPPPAPVSKRPADKGPDASGKKRKKSQATDGALSAEGTPSKRKKKDKNTTATPGDAPANPVTLLDDSNLVPGLSAASELASATPTKRTPKPRKPRGSKSGAGRQSAGNDAAAFAENIPGEAPAADQSEASQPAEPGPAPSSALNLPPGEAARRREVATNLLRQNGVDPSTLSDEQFNIFANQSPKYQQESLQMLVKYGAERLRVVHPTSSSGTPAPANGQAPQANDGTAGTSTVAASPSPSTKENGAAVATSKARAKPKQTRGSCDGCKTRKVKCSRQKPSCSECIDKGLQCLYPPPRVRNKSSGAPEIVQDELDESNVSMQEQEQETSDLDSPGFGTSNQASTDLMSPSFDQPDPYGQASHTSYPSITTDMAHFPSGVQATVGPSSEMDYDQALAHNGTHQTDSYYQSQAASSSVYPDPVSSSSVGTVQAAAGEDRSSSRRSLPSVPRTQKQAGYSSAQDSTPSSWQALPTPVSTRQASSASKQTRSRKSGPTSTYDTGQAYEGLQQAAVISQAGAQQPAQQSPVARNSSPFQTQGSRTKSRQGHRSQQSSSNAVTSLYSAPAATDSTSNNTYDSSSPYSTSGSQANTQSSSRIAYEPYSQNPNSTSSTSYSSYDSNKNRSHTTSSVSLSNPVTQSMSASYSTSTAPSTNSWATSSNRNTQSYTANHSTTGSSSYNLPSTSTQQSSTLQSFHVRPRSTAPQAKTSSSSYTQQPEQQQFYGPYSSQSHTSTNQQPQDWYGFTAANNSSNNYRSSSRNSGSGGYGQTTQNNSYHQQHGHLDGGDQALYDLLRGGSGH